MRAEIHQQPQALRRLLDDGLDPIRSVAGAVRRRRPRFAVLAGRGTSDHAALYAKYLVETRLALPAGLASPSTLTRYGARPDLTDVLWIVVSQSGGSPDLLESTAIARDCGALTLAVTNAPGSELAAAAELSIDVLAGEELAVAATKSYTAQLLALLLLVDAVAGGDGELARELPDHVASMLAEDGPASVSGAVDACAQRYRFVERLVVTGRGHAYPTAREAALKLMETSYLSAHAFSSADLMHGPLAMIDVDRPVIAVAADGVGSQALEPVLDRLQARGADVLLVAGRKVLDRWGGGRSTAGIALPDVAEEIAPVVQIVPLQLLALTMSVARGYDPDTPRGLAKRTFTR